MEDLQSLLEKINRDGVEKAEAEAKKIVEAAQEKAKAILAEATAVAAKAREDAARDAEMSAARATETIRQAARDVIIGVKDAVSALLDQLLVNGVDKTLSDEAAAGAIVATAVKDLVGPGEIACGEKLVKALSAQLAAKKDFTVVTDDTLGSGFTVKLEGGRVEHAFTVEVIASELAKRLRPDLAKLLK